MGTGAAVLIRALEPLAGLAEMSARRGGLERAEDLCSGPGKLTQALGIGLELNASDLAAGPVVLGSPCPPTRDGAGVVTGRRIGITKAPDLEWRFCAVGSRSVSRPWPPGLRERLR